MTNALEILIPCKGYHQGKSRLSAILDPTGRAAFCRQLARRTFRRAGAIADGARIIVVSDDPLVLEEARISGAICIVEAGFGLNAALRLANAALLASAKIGAGLLVLPIDLPFAIPSVLAKAMGDGQAAVIAPDRAGTGTNLLFLPASMRASFAFAYGPGSFERHCAALRADGCEPRISRDWRLAFDLDEPADHREWLARMRRPR